MPERACVHALEVLDHFEHANLAMALDEGLEPLRDLVELLGRQAAGKHDLDRLRIVIFLIGKHGLPYRKASAARRTDSSPLFKINSSIKFCVGHAVAAFSLAK